MHLTLPKPFDAHLHLRDGDMLGSVVPASSAHFSDALVMPNLTPPVTQPDAARAYRERIMAAVPTNHRFTPHMTCYLTDDTNVSALIHGFEQGDWIAAKLYPAHATTNSAAGVTDPMALQPVFQAMADAGMPLCIHGEVPDPAIDVFDREDAFIERVLGPLRSSIPHLRMVFEHITTARAVDFVRKNPGSVFATITAHHLWWTRNDLFDGGLRPHAYCLPILKRAEDRTALVEAATSGEPAFFAGTDSAPHTKDRKECDHGCAGVFSSPSAMSAYAQIFEDAGRLDRLAGFCSRHGREFYGLSQPSEMLQLQRSSFQAPKTMELPDGRSVEIFLGAQALNWAVA